MGNYQLIPFQYFPALKGNCYFLAAGEGNKKNFFNLKSS